MYLIADESEERVVIAVPYRNSIINPASRAVKARGAVRFVYIKKRLRSKKRVSYILYEVV